MRWGSPRTWSKSLCWVPMALEMRLCPPPGPLILRLLTFDRVASGELAHCSRRVLSGLGSLYPGLLSQALCRRGSCRARAYPPPIPRPFCQNFLHKWDRRSHVAHGGAGGHL